VRRAPLTAAQQPKQGLRDGVFGCYTEEYFHELLAIERKRSERSKRPFLVMTLNYGGIRDGETRNRFIRDALRSLSTITRETDIKGWYRRPSVLGVIFTEMNSLETENLQKKVFQGFCSGLPEEQLNTLQIWFHRFPDNGSREGQVASVPFLFYPEVPKKQRSRKTEIRMKRLLDIVGSITGIVLFSPFLLLIPVGIKLTSQGPVLFRQVRVGQYEKRFPFLKFRSMHVNNDPSVHKKYVHDLIEGKATGDAGAGGNGKKVFKITRDKRVTPFGHFLRKTSLDELPQFFNVLKGDMSLVGPRPCIPYELEKYDNWHRCRVMEVKPGITGLWQVMGRSSTTFDEMVRLDLQYAKEWSFWMDLKILLKTPKAVLGGKGAY
jgi:exopolysaccharide biosynthesis polyprenyl glycosylphosphotransferase